MFSYITFFVAFLLSSVSAFYSVTGLTAIFAGAFWSVVILGSTLEIGKIITAMWLHKYWSRASLSYKLYLVPALIFLMVLTSLGVYGFLSKAHLEQGVVGGEVQAKVLLLDEKIKIQKENIDTARKALQQMDAQVDQRLARGDSENGAERAVAIRRGQAAERARLLKEISDAQATISKINEERAPVASQLRKVEAEVGPIKYIAALIYGDGTDNTTLEKAVRWVTILIVAVFDPLAIILILAANHSLRWEREDRLKPVVEDVVVEPEPVQEVSPATPEPLPAAVDEPAPPGYDPELDEGALVSTVYMDPPPPEPVVEVPAVDPEPAPEPVERDFRDGAYTSMKYITAGTPPTVTQAPGYPQPAVDEPADKPAAEVVDESIAASVKPPIIETEGVTKEVKLKDHDEEYTVYNGKKISWDALKQLRPDMAVGVEVPNQIIFGIKFPSVAKSGDIYTRVDVQPHRTYKFNGEKWIDVDRGQNTSYLQNIAYIQYLISKIDSGEYDAEQLTEAEQEEITGYLKRST